MRPSACWLSTATSSRASPRRCSSARRSRRPMPTPSQASGGPPRLSSQCPRPPSHRRHRESERKAMPSPDDQTSHRIRDKTKDGSEQVGELRSAFRALHGPPSSQRPLSFGFAPLLERIASYWWVELLIGVLWMVIAVVVLKFNHASVTTVGILTGLMFLLFAAEDFLLAFLDHGARWLWAIFGMLMTAAGIVALIHPRNTFAAFADILGFVFLVIGIQWMIQAFAERAINSLWWLALISGILIIRLASWVSGQFYLTRAFTLLVFAGVWAMTNGIIAIVRAFAIREFGQRLRRPFAP